MYYEYSRTTQGLGRSYSRADNCWSMGSRETFPGNKCFMFTWVTFFTAALIAMPSSPALLCQTNMLIGDHPPRKLLQRNGFTYLGLHPRVSPKLLKLCACLKFSEHKGRSLQQQHWKFMVSCFAFIRAFNDHGFLFRKESLRDWTELSWWFEVWLNCR